MIPYTIGNWTISRLHAGSGSAKNYSIPKIDFPAEFSRTEKPIGRKQANEQEAYYASISSDSLSPSGTLMIGRDRIANIYTTRDYDSSAQLAQKNGVKLWDNLTLYFKAVNSVSGQECYFPLSGSMQLTIPATAIVTTDALYDFAGYLVSTLFSEDSVQPDLAADVLRGDLDPTR